VVWETTLLFALTGRRDDWILSLSLPFPWAWERAWRGSSWLWWRASGVGWQRLGLLARWSRGLLDERLVRRLP